jgi:hypothetical protein
MSEDANLCTMDAYCSQVQNVATPPFPCRCKEGTDNGFALVIKHRAAHIIAHLNGSIRRRIG